jgi:exopolysaccharide biosynthesis protein
MKNKIWLAALLLSGAASFAQMIVGEWNPIYQGIDHAVGTNLPNATIPRLQVVHCIRVDLTDPDVQLFTTPRASNYVAESRETLTLTVSNFLKNSGLQVAVNAGFYNATPGGSDPSSEGLPCEVRGLQICTGAVVSVQDTGNRYCALLFDTNKDSFFAFNNTPPGTNTAGIYTAITGYYPVLTNGVNLWAIYYNALAAIYTDPSIHDPQPRTAFGVSQDSRYLFLMTIDGRQGGYSDGAIDTETAMWLLQFGAWNAINLDGGGSTAMYRADSCGNPLPVNHSSYVAQTGGRRERIIGSHFGIYAKPLQTFISDVHVTPGSDTAIVGWTTSAEASSQVDYGLTTSYGLSSRPDLTMVTNHSVTLDSLKPGTRYYFRIRSFDGAQEYTLDYCSPFYTTNIFMDAGWAFGLTNAWKYSVASLDGISSWKAPGFDDSSWTNGRGVLWCDATYPGGNTVIQFLPLSSISLPINTNASPVNPYITYYCRTYFNFTNEPAGTILSFSNYLDDGAVFYLNGVEIQRLSMPASPTVITNGTLAPTYSCQGGNATCPTNFAISGGLITNLFKGTNLLAVEVHNFNAKSPDITFGCALSYLVPPPAPPTPPFITNMVVVPGETNATITWQSRSNSTSRVEYGLTPSLGTFTPLDSTLVTNHLVKLSGLQLLTNYYFRVLSSVGATQYAATGSFSTVPFYASIVNLTNTWKYSTNNWDGMNWSAPGFDDGSWPAGQALLWVDQGSVPNPDVEPKFTPMPWNDASGLPWTTYYFRGQFILTNLPPGFSLVFSNFIDDGAVFYVNGAEVQRLRMPPTPQPITNATFATDKPVTDDAVYPDVFRLWGNALTNLVSGTNLLAVEVHNVNATSPDITFGSAVGLVRALASETEVQIGASNGVIQISWVGTYLKLQQSANPAETNSWSDLPVTVSPLLLTNPPGVSFYRLRN